MRRKKHKLKKSIKKLILFIIIVLLLFVCSKLILNKTYIKSIEISNNKAIIHLKKDNLSCILSNKEVNQSSNWTESNNKTCEIEIENNINNIYIKDEDKIVNETNNHLIYELYENDIIYLAHNEEYNIIKYLIGNIDKIKVSIDNDNIINYSNGIIKGIKDGKSSITLSYNDKSFKYNVVVTSLIDKMEIKNKQALSCNKYSSEESQLLDEILKSRIKNAGYKTRAGAVEAARFLALSFPYKIEYFYENGRQTTNNVDGEGRYYHEGLYLNESKFDSLTGSTYSNNKGIWGCSIYSYPIEKKSNNGLDCSGFVSWALLNGGFDVKDVGAGWSDSLDLTDYGEVLKLTSSNYSDIKVGDLLHSNRLGGHIGIIIGSDKKNFYVAQAIWYDEKGIATTKIKKEELYKEFPHAVLMDEYYQNDGKLTNMWN